MTDIGCNVGCLCDGGVQLFSRDVG